MHMCPPTPLPCEQAAAPQAGPSLLEQLFSWRQAMLDELGQRKDMAAQRKQVRLPAGQLSDWVGSRVLLLVLVHVNATGAAWQRRVVVPAALARQAWAAVQDACM